MVKMEFHFFVFLIKDRVHKIFFSYKYIRFGSYKFIRDRKTTKKLAKFSKKLQKIISKLK